MDLKLKNKIVLIAGSSKGIGFAIAQAFVNEGAKVAITGRDSESLETGRYGKSQNNRQRPQKDRISFWQNKYCNRKCRKRDRKERI